MSIRDESRTTSKRVSSLTEVKRRLLEDASLSARRLAGLIGIPIIEVKQAFKALKGSLPDLPEKPSGVGDVLRRIMERDVLQDARKLKDISDLVQGQVQPGNLTAAPFPDTLELHLGSTCQCACRFCWRWPRGEWRLGDKGDYRGLRGGQPLLTSGDVRALLAEFKQMGGKQLYFSGGLEFFTSPIAKDALASAMEEGLSLNVYSNGLAGCLDDSKFLDLVVRAARSVRISLHAATPQTYADVQMPHGGHGEKEFENVRRHIVNLLAARSQRGLSSEQCHLSVTFLAIEKNHLEMEEAVTWARDVGLDEFDLRLDMLRGNSWFTPAGRQSLHEVMRALQGKIAHGCFTPLEVNCRWDALRSRDRTVGQLEKPQWCYIPMKKPVIDPWGNVYACCYRAHPAFQEPDFLLGNVGRGQTLRSVFDVQSRRVLRRAHCAQCTDWELCYNKCAQKLLDDREDDIAATDQPF